MEKWKKNHQIPLLSLRIVPNLAFPKLTSYPAKKFAFQHKNITRINSSFPALATKRSIWENNVMVTPLERAYNKEDMEPYYGKPIEIDGESDQQQQQMEGDKDKPIKVEWIADNEPNFNLFAYIQFSLLLWITFFLLILYGSF